MIDEGKLVINREFFIQHIKLDSDHLMINTKFRTKREIYDGNILRVMCGVAHSFEFSSSPLSRIKISRLMNLANSLLVITITCPNTTLASPFCVAQHVIISENL